LRYLPDVTKPSLLNAITRAFLAGSPLKLAIRAVTEALRFCLGTCVDGMAPVRHGDIDYAVDNNSELQPVLRQTSMRYVRFGNTPRRVVRTRTSSGELKRCVYTAGGLVRDGGRLSFAV
jgi:hypothetical protein